MKKHIQRTEFRQLHTNFAIGIFGDHSLKHWTTALKLVNAVDAYGAKLHSLFVHAYYY